MECWVAGHFVSRDSKKEEVSEEKKKGKKGLMMEGEWKGRGAKEINRLKSRVLDSFSAKKKKSDQSTYEKPIEFEDFD